MHDSLTNSTLTAVPGMGPVAARRGQRISRALKAQTVLGQEEWPVARGYSAWRMAVMVGVLILSDALTIGGAFGLSMLCERLLLGQSLLNWPQCVLVGAATVVLFALAGFYPGIPASPRRHASRTTAILLVIFSALGGWIYHDWAHWSAWLPVGVAFGLTLPLVLLARTTLRLAGGNWDWWGYRVVVVGPRKSVRAVVGHLRSHRYVGLKVVAAVVDRPLRHRSMGVPTVAGYEHAQRVCHEYGVAHGVLAVDQLSSRATVAAVSAYAGHLPHLYVIPSHFRATGFDLNVADAGGAVSVHLRRRQENAHARRLRYAVEWLAAVPLGVVALPIMAAVAIIVKLDSRGPVFYSQPRFGVGGRCFKVLKFRTMAIDAEQKLQDLLMGDPRLRDEYERYHKMHVDPRVTRVGRILRKLSLDELPQLYNVLKGDMALIGPRPYAADEREQLGRAAGIILSIRPGLTGYWQTFARSSARFQQRVAMDVYYVRHRSLALDLFILIRTVWVVLIGSHSK